MSFATGVAVASLLSQASCSTKVGGLIGRSECQYHVTDQTIVVEAPVIYDVNVGEECPFDDFGQMHLDICTDCGDLDNQCGGEFVACAGCCKLPKKARYHTCENIKKYFFEKNSKSIVCDARMDLDDGDVNVEYGEETTDRDDKSGTLVSTCEADVMKADATGVPMKMKFDCTGCALQGNPDLLQQCCQKAEDFQHSVTVRKLEDDGFTVFVWADGCNEKWIGRDDSIEFKKSYPRLKEATIDRKMRDFVEDNYCTKARDQSTDTCKRRLFGRDPWLMNESQHLTSSHSSNVTRNFKNPSNTSRHLSVKEDKEDCPWLFDSESGDYSASDVASGLSLSLTAMLVTGIAYV